MLHGTMGLGWTSMRLERNSRKLIRLLEQDGWYYIGATGDHHHFRHTVKPGKVTVPHPNTDISIGTLRSIYYQAGWLKRGKE